VNRLFVYGTLLPGQSNWHVLAPFVADEGVPDTARGSMFDTRLGWPAVAFDGTAVVAGRVFTLRDEGLDRALAVLDEFEGIHEGAYTRIAITTDAGATAWAYHAAQPFEHSIESGDWPGYLRADA